MTKKIYTMQNETAKREAYESVRESGVTNMFDIPKVIRFAMELADVEMTKEDILHIMKTYKR